jgi:predicted PurR-regulated permease PerM
LWLLAGGALLPASRRDAAERFFEAARRRLSRWLLGQGVSMTIVGLTMALALRAIGMPLALTLGVLDGVFELFRSRHAQKRYT